MIQPWVGSAAPFPCSKSWVSDMGILESFRLDKKNALVTGAGRGLGQAIAVGLAEAGADIAGLDVISLDETRILVEKTGHRFLPVTCNLRDSSPNDLQEIVREIALQLGKGSPALNILVNNAGIIRRAPALDYSETDWDDVLHINLKAVFFLSQACARIMFPQGSGKIINIASMLSFQGGILVPSYTAAKSGVAGITHALANEWAGKGINVNAIAPGYMATDNTAPLRADASRSQAILERIPAGRWGEPADLMGIAVFLASTASDYLNGAIIPVDGGWLSR
jgi:2-deoxy-D-gluconate 3-dehydrogenase